MLKAWHFVADKLRDGSPVPADGKWLVFKGKPVLCQQGLHASKHPFDALYYAPGATLCLVECAGTVLEQEDKLVCTERRILKRIDATQLLRSFAKQQALSVVHLWDAPQVVLDYLHGDDSKREAAKSAARSAAESAARSAAESAARNAAESAAWNAAWNAAWSAAWNAMGSAARNAAWNAARSAAESAAWSAAWSAADSAAESAVRSAAESKARDSFLALVQKELG